MAEAVYLYDAVRTPRGRAREDGAFATLNPLALIEPLFVALAARSASLRELADDVVLGCVTQTGEQGGNIAKLAVNYAGWSEHLPGMTVTRYCASALDALGIATAKVAAGMQSIVLAGGVESMSRVAMLADKPPAFFDPVLAARIGNVPLGIGADLVASLHGIDREQADGYAVRSQQRAATAREAGWFRSLVPVPVPVTGVTVGHDEAIRPNASTASLGQLSPVFQELGARGIDAALLRQYPQLKRIDHIHTAGNSPAMVDGASLAIIGHADAGARLGLAPRARIVAFASACDTASLVLTGGIKAAKMVLAQAGLTIDDIDLVEFNEAFAATSLYCQRELGVDSERYNVNGGAIALGHPMGATGVILIGMAVDELERRGGKRALVAISGAAGVGSSVIIERP